MWINRHANKKIKSLFSKYYSYTCRHWCAIARLIRTKIETKHFDVYEVKEWMGHTKIQTTMDYVQHAKFYYTKTGYDWIKRVLKNHHKSVEENSLELEKPCFHTVQNLVNRRKRGTPPTDCKLHLWRKLVLDISKLDIPIYSLSFYKQ